MKCDRCGNKTFLIDKRGKVGKDNWFIGRLVCEICHKCISAKILKWGIVPDNQKIEDVKNENPRKSS